MLKYKNIVLLLVLVHVIPHHFLRADARLSDFDFRSASVLPFITINNKKYFVLSRESMGKSKGTYDDFGGSRDEGENHPMITAAREFFEEGMIQDTIGLDLAATEKFIDVDKHSTMFVIVFGHNVTYIVNFNAYAKMFFNNFYSARKKIQEFLRDLRNKERLVLDNQAKKQLSLKKKESWVRLEKDSIAIVGWDMLKATIAQNKESTGITMNAAVLSAKDIKWHKEQVTLRPYFVKKLRSFFMDEKYEVAKQKKIRFYTTREVQKSDQTNPSQESRWKKFWQWLKSYGPQL